MCFFDITRMMLEMKSIKCIKVIVLQLVLISGNTVASDSYSNFRDIDTVDELLTLPVSKLCSNGGPTSNEIKFILSKGPMTMSMYQHDPAGAKIIINEQSVSIKSKIKEKCSSNLHMPSRKLTEEMLKDEDKLCKQGAPTKEEIKALIRESNNPKLNIDKKIQSFPHEYRLMMEEGAKLKGYTLREMMIEDIAIKAAESWKKACEKNKLVLLNNDKSR